MRRTFLASITAGLLLAALIPAAVTASATYSVAFQSDGTWTAYTDAGLTNALGSAQPVCLNATDPYASGCPAGATDYGWASSSAWTADLSSAPAARWVWAPDVTGSTSTTIDQQVYFSKTFDLAGPATGGSISIAADNDAQVFVNGTLVGTVGDVTTPGTDTASFNTLSTFTVPASAFKAGPNVITVYAVNAPNDATTYAGNPAGVVFFGTIDGTVDTAPVVTSVTVAPVPAALGTSVAISATYTDPDSPDAHTATVDCGNGTTVTGTVTEPSGATPGTVAATCTYSSAGLYTVTVTVTDSYGKSGSGGSTAVIYDPSAGFVTGGGWVTDVNSDRANFGFVAKYQAGASTPVGSLEYQYTGGDFHSNSFSYLVVSGDTATLAGTGTLDGATGYSFVLTVTDGSPDQLQIAISGPAGYAYSSSSALQDIGKGSIQIHS